MLWRPYWPAVSVPIRFNPLIGLVRLPMVGGGGGGPSLATNWTLSNQNLPGMAVALLSGDHILAYMPPTVLRLSSVGLMGNTRWCQRPSPGGDQVPSPIWP